MNIVVLAGGLSTERDVSLITGNMVSKALKKNGHQTILLDVFLGYEEEKELKDIFDRVNEINAQVSSIQEMEPDIEGVKAMRKDKSNCFFGPNVLKMCQMADVVFMALHGENGENGKVQATFDLLGIKYTGSGSLSSALAMDKGITKKLFVSKGIPTPQGITLKKKEKDLSFKEFNLKFPCVVKPCCGGSSIGVYIVNNQNEYKEALDAAFCYEEEVVVEDFIQGREFSVGVIEGDPLPIIEIAPIQGFYDYKNKYQAGSAVETCPADLNEELTKQMQDYAKKVCEVLGLETYSRMDFLLDVENKMYCLEANTLPGMTPTSLLPQEAAAIGVSFEELCEKLIQVSMKKYN